MTLLQKYSNVESTYSPVNIIFILTIALSKKDLNQYLSTVVYHSTLTGSLLSMLAFIVTVVKSVAACMLLFSLKMYRT